MDRIKHLETILVLVLALLLIDYFWVGGKHLIDNKYMFWGAITLAFIGVFIPFFAGKIHWAWMKLAHVMGYVMSKVMLTLVYVLVVLPMAAISRKKLSVRLTQGGPSYFKERNHTYKKEDLEDVW